MSINRFVYTFISLGFCGVFVSKSLVLNSWTSLSLFGLKSYIEEVFKDFFQTRNSYSLKQTVKQNVDQVIDIDIRN